MRVIVNYGGTEILVDEKIKECLDELKRQEEVMNRRNRRHEILWDSTLLEGMEAAREIAESLESIEDGVIKKIFLDALDNMMETLEEIDRLLIVDRFINQMKYRELSSKYGIADSTIESRINKVLGYLKYELTKK
jgi:RNA polymerase sigma factor (sigma-70 family)